MTHAAAQSRQPRYLSIAASALAALAIANAVGDARADSLASIPMLQFPGQAKAQKQETPACPGGICPGLANVFYLPEQNAETTPIGGAVMFKNRKLDECATISSIHKGQRTFVTADSMRDFMSKTMINFNLSGDYKTSELTVKGTASAMTGSSSSITSQFHSRQLEVLSLSAIVDFDLNSKCYSESNIDPAFLQAFESLAPINPANVAEAAQWAPYESFLKQRGSHIMLQQLIGSRFEQWNSSTSTSTLVGKILEIKACAQVEGVQKGGGWSVASCATYTQEEKEKALQQQSFEKTVIAGGTAETRGALLKGVNKPTLDAFIDSAANSNEAVRATFTPVWRILIDIYSIRCAKSGKGSKDCDNLQRAVNLQATYEGWVAVGCLKENDGRGQFMQRMALDGTTTLGINTYRCLLSKTGCRADSDCHTGGAGTVCYCYGQGCIDTGPQVSGTAMFRNKVRGTQSGSYNEGVNNSCNYKFLAGCSCDTGWAGGLAQRTIYLQSSP